MKPVNVPYSNQNKGHFVFQVCIGIGRVLSFLQLLIKHRKMSPETVLQFCFLMLGYCDGSKHSPEESKAIIELKEGVDSAAILGLATEEARGLVLGKRRVGCVGGEF